MTVTLTKTLGKINPSGVHSEPEFLNLQLMYLHKVLPGNHFTTVPVTEIQAYRSAGNFYKLLVMLKIPSECFWLTLHLNGMKTPTEFDGKINDPEMVIVSPEFVKQLASEYTSKVNKN